MVDLITPVPEPLRSFIPNMCYFVLDEGRVQPLAPNNILSTIIQIEWAPDTEQLAAALQRAHELLKAPEHQSLRRSLLGWLKRVVLFRITGNREFAKIKELQEVYTVLAERVTQWTQNWHEQGRQEGLQEGLQLGDQKAAIALAERGFSIAEIAKALKLEEFEVRRMLG